MAGIKETKEIVDFGISLANAIGASLEDGKIGFDDLTRFFGTVTKIPAAFGGLSELGAELSDLTPEEVEELKQFIVDEFDIPQDKVEQIAEAAIDLVVKLWAFVQMFKPEPTEPTP